MARAIARRPMSWSRTGGSDERQFSATFVFANAGAAVGNPEPALLPRWATSVAKGKAAARVLEGRRSSPVIARRRGKSRPERRFCPMRPPEWLPHRRSVILAVVAPRRMGVAQQRRETPRSPRRRGKERGGVLSAGSRVRGSGADRRVLWTMAERKSRFTPPPLADSRGLCKPMTRGLWPSACSEGCRTGVEGLPEGPLTRPFGP